MRFSKGQIAVIATASAMLAGFFLAVYRPLHARRLRIRRDAQSQIKAIDAAERQLQSLIQQKRTADKFAELSKDFQQKLPEQRRLGEFLRRLSACIEKRKLNDPVIEPDEPKSFGRYGVQGVTISCKGPFNALYGLLHGLESMSRLAEIETLNITNDKDFSGELKLQMKLNLYFQQRADI